MRLAREIVGQFHSAEAAQQAEAEFTRVFREREAPGEVTELRLSLKRDFVASTSEIGWRTPGEEAKKVEPLRRHSLPHILQAARLVESVSEGRRLIEQGAVDRLTEQGFERVQEPYVPLYDGVVLRIGKRRFLRIVDADKQSQS